MFIDTVYQQVARERSRRHLSCCSRKRGPAGPGRVQAARACGAESKKQSVSLFHPPEPPAYSIYRSFRSVKVTIIQKQGYVVIPTSFPILMSICGTG